MEVAKTLYRGFDTHVEVDLEEDPVGDPALIKREGLVRVVAMPLVLPLVYFMMKRLSR